MKARFLLLLCAALALLSATQAFAGFEAFLKMDPLQGESTNPNHSNEIVVLSYSHNLTNSGGFPTVTDLTITKPLDKASPGLFLACVTGAHYPTVILTMHKAGPSTNHTDFLKITMTDVVVSSVKPATISLQDDRPVEQVTLNFQQIQWQYQQIDANSNPVGGPIVTTFSRGPGG